MQPNVKHIRYIIAARPEAEALFASFLAGDHWEFPEPKQYQDILEKLYGRALLPESAEPIRHEFNELGASRAALCSDCTLCERSARGVELWSKCRAVNRRIISQFANHPLAYCPAGKWLAQFPLLPWGEATQEAGIVIGSDDNAFWQIRIFIDKFRRTGSRLPLHVLNFGLSAESLRQLKWWLLPQDTVGTPDNSSNHPMYRKVVCQLTAPFRVAVWFDSDIILKIRPEELLAEFTASGKPMGLRRGEPWYVKTHRADNWHGGVHVYRHGNPVTQRWASWCAHGDGCWITQQDTNQIRDEELFCELYRLEKPDVWEMPARYCRLESEYNGPKLGEPLIDCSKDNCHYPGRHGKRVFCTLGSIGLQPTPDEIEAGLTAAKWSADQIARFSCSCSPPSA